MRNNRVLLTARRRLMLLAVAAVGLASAAPAAQAQSEPDKPAAASEPTPAASKPNAWTPQPSSVEGVTVSASRYRPDIGVPPEKAAAYGVEAAKTEAWRKYRKSMPPLTDNPNDDSKDFPGIQIRPSQ